VSARTGLVCAGWEHTKGAAVEPWYMDEMDPELQALMRVGARRRNRWFNDRLLRELAGPLDVDDMKALFAPPPFGTPAPPSTMQIVSVRVPMPLSTAHTPRTCLARHTCERVENPRGGGEPNWD
jgi:hypothetical protein